MKQILLNLISNSVKFCRSGSIALICRYLPDSNEVRLTISDTGIGIKKEELGNIFNDFVMLEDTNNLNRQGSGLGLSICKTLSNLLDLKLEFNSIYGSGTETSINFPILEIDEPDLETLREYNEQIPRKSNYYFIFIIIYAIKCINIFSFKY